MIMVRWVSTVPIGGCVVIAQGVCAVSRDRVRRDQPMDVNATPPG